MREMAKMELPALEEKKEEQERQLRNLLIPKDPYDEKIASQMLPPMVISLSG